MSTVEPDNLTSWWADKIGRKVIFRYLHGEEQEGVVTSVNIKYVFVRFGTAVGSESCDPSLLRLAVGGNADESKENDG